MRTETKIGVVAGFAVVVAASVYFWKSKARDRDLIVSLTPSVTQPLQAGGASRPGGNPAPPEAMPTQMAAAPAAADVKPPVTLVSKPGPALPVLSPPAATPVNSPEQLASSPQFNSSPRPSVFGPPRSGPSVSPGMSLNDRPASAIKPPLLSESATGPAPAPAIQLASRDPARIADSTSSGTVKLPPAIAQPPAPAVKTAGGSEWKSTVGASAPGEWPKYHTVAKGETLAAISRKTYGDARRVDLILAANPEIKNPRQVRVGAKLTLPSAPDAAKPNAGSDTEVAAAATNDSKPVSLMARTNATPVDAKPEPPAANPLPDGKTYTVRQGDSLYSIAVETLGDGRRWPELMKANKTIVGADGSKIRPGMVLTIPGDGAAAKSGTEQSAKR